MRRRVCPYYVGGLVGAAGRLRRRPVDRHCALHSDVAAKLVEASNERFARRMMTARRAGGFVPSKSVARRP